MTEKSYFHNGTVTGDALEAPYSAALFNKIRSILFASEGCYVIPTVFNAGLTNCLEVTAAAGRTVDISYGQAFLNGIYYINDAAKNITLSQNTSAYPRIDRIIVRADTDTQTARLTVVRGSPAVIPTIPAINTCPTMIDLPIVRIYQPAAYAATSNTLIYDERVFTNNVYHQNYYTLENTLTNADWLGMGAPVGLLRPLPSWTYNYTYTNLEARLSDMEDGRTLVLPIFNASPLTTTILTSEVDTDVFTLSAELKVNSGVCQFVFGGVTKNIYPTSEWVTVLIRASVTGYQTLTIQDAVGTGEIKLGRITFNHGYATGQTTRSQNEFVFYNFPTQPYGTGYPITGRLSTSTTLMNSDWWKIDTLTPTITQPALLTGTRGVLVKLGARDSASAASTTARASLLSKSSSELLRLDLGGVPNDTWRYTFGLLPLEDYIYNTDDAFQFYLDVVATGANTLEVTIDFCGVMI